MQTSIWKGGDFFNWVMQLLELASSDHIEQARMLKIQGRGDRAGEKARRWLRALVALVENSG